MEKMVIIRFTDGLKNEKLNTIIAARQYILLKDAIQAAKDESPSSSSVFSPAEVIEVSALFRGSYNNLERWLYLPLNMYTSNMCICMYIYVYRHKGQNMAYFYRYTRNHGRNVFNIVLMTIATAVQMEISAITGQYTP